MSTLLSSSRGVKLAVTLELVMSVFLVACGAQATAAPEPVAATLAPAKTEASKTDTPSANSNPGSATETPVQAPSGAVSFSKDVLPILQSRCVSCHGGERTSNGLDMTTYDNLMAGSQNGPVVTAGDANNSLLIQLINQGKMPKRGPKLLPEQVQVLIDWINGGALNN